MMWMNAYECRKTLGGWALESLIREAELSPKPGLVDPEDTGSHADMNYELMIESAQSLKQTFETIAEVSFKRVPDQNLREEIAAIGREGEKHMLQTTNGVNTHKGAIWVVGLLTSGAAINKPGEDIKTIVQTASMLARLPDRYAPNTASHGSEILKKYGVKGARGEATGGFPRLMNIALPQLEKSRRRGFSEDVVLLNTLISLMAHLEDTCIIHRSGLVVLHLVQNKANEILDFGGVSTKEGWVKLKELNQLLLDYQASPGGSADLLAAAIYMDRLLHLRKVERPLAAI